MSTSHLIKAIINTGIYDTHSEIDKTCIRMINLVSCLGFTIYFLFFLGYLIINVFWAWLPNLIGALNMILLLFFNYKRKYNLARYYLIIVVPVYILMCTLLWGAEIGVEYYILALITAPPLLFKIKKTIILLWLWDCLCFFMIKMAYHFFNPIFTHPSWQIAYYLNLIAISILILSILFFYQKQQFLYIEQINEKKLELEYLNNELNKWRIELRQSNDTKNKLFSLIAHDLKNPFSILYSLVTFLSDKYSSLDEEHKLKIINKIKQAIVNNLELVNNLLDWSRSQQQKIYTKKVHVDIEDTIEDILESLTSFITKKNITIKKKYCKHNKILVDLYMFSVIMRNLITNAVKFSYKNSKIIIKTTEQEKYIHIQVIDAGIGISKSHIKKLFRNDINVSKIGHSIDKGTGLGLILCKEFTEANGGRITVQSKKDVGSIFSVFLRKSIPKG